MRTVLLPRFPTLEADGRPRRWGRVWGHQQRSAQAGGASLPVPCVFSASPASRWAAAVGAILVLVVFAELVLMAAAQPARLGARAEWRDEELRITWVQPVGPAWDAGLRPGAVLVQIAGQIPLADSAPALLADAPHVVARMPDGRLIEASTTSSTVTITGASRLVFLTIAACFMAVGSLVYLLASDRPAGRVLFGFTIATATALAGALGAHLGVAWVLAIEYTALVSFGASTLVLFLVFPVNYLGGSRGRFVAAGVISVSVALEAAYAWVVAVDSAAYDLLRPVTSIVLAAELLGAVGLMLLALIHRDEQQVVRRSLGLIAFGTVVALSPFALLCLVPWAVGLPNVVPPDVAILSIVVLPISLGAAIMSRQVLGIERIVRRSLVAALVWIGLLGVYSVAALLVKQMTASVGVAAVLSSSLVGVAIVGSTFWPMQAYCRRVLERVLFRDLYDYRGTLQQLSTEVGLLSADTQSIAGHVLRRLGETLDLCWAAIILDPWSGAGDGEPQSPQSSGGPVVFCWGVCPKGIEGASIAAAVREESAHCPDIAERYQIIALRSGGGLLGGLVVGPKRHDVELLLEDGALLTTLAPLVTTALSNARLAQSLQRQVEALAHRETALQQANQRLAEALQDLKRTQEQVAQQERLRALGQLASGIAHDFNNALVPVTGYCELLLMSPDALKDTGTLQKYLQLIYTGAQDAASVVRRLREFYRQREEHEPFTAVNLPQLVEEAVLLTRPLWKDEAQSQGRTIQVLTEIEDVPVVVGQEAQLREALTNLMFNAADAMPLGGTITVRVCSNGQSGIVEVSDTGVGMSDEVRQRCLEPFFSTKGTRGTGLGLPMVHGIIQRHQGALEIESTLGQGTRMVMRLPLHDPGHSTVHEEVPSPRLDHSLRLLVIDDEPSLRDVLTAYLTVDGHVVEAYSSGEVALQGFRPDLVDVVITDRAMPGLSGDQVAARIKSASPVTPVIMLTGFGDLMQGAGEQPAGVDAIVGKPVTLSVLRATLAQFAY